MQFPIAGNPTPSCRTPEFIPCQKSNSYYLHSYMKQTQINRLEMLKATNAYLDVNAGIYSPVPIIVKYKNDLFDVIAGIQKAAQEQDAAQVFIGESKAQLKRLIAEKMDILDDTVESYAADTENAELLSAVSNSMSDYYKLPNEVFETKVKNVIETMEAHIEAMADYGMTQQMIEDVKLQFNEFEEKSGKPSTYRIASRIATQDLEGLFKDATTVTEKLDKVMKRFKRSNASFYNGYLAARTVVDS